MSKPIIFSAPMVRALLEGRKTQTRRMVKFPLRDPDFGCELAGSELGPSEIHRLCPYGSSGSLLWVREAFFLPDAMLARGTFTGGSYKADVPDYMALKYTGWRSPIYMPRWASRLTLRITDVRVQRVQDISEDDARAEGVERTKVAVSPSKAVTTFRAGEYTNHDPRLCYAALFDSINGTDSWGANPWVWALTFDVIQKNVDEVTS